jgi:hypothetical protein
MYAHFFLATAGLLAQNEEMEDSVYLMRHPVLVPVIEWGGALLLTSLVLIPFLLLFIPRLRPIKWSYVGVAYLSSVGIYSALWWYLTSYENWLEIVFSKNHWLDRAFLWAQLRWMLGSLIVWVVSPFLVVKAKYRSFTKLRIVAAFIVAIINLIIWIYVALTALGYALGRINSGNF